MDGVAAHFAAGVIDEFGQERFRVSQIGASNQFVSHPAGTRVVLPVVEEFFEVGQGRFLASGGFTLIDDLDGGTKPVEGIIIGAIHGCKDRGNRI